jgi:LSD1 subclass zinc finger protein
MEVKAPDFASHPGVVRWAKQQGDAVVKGEHLLDLDFEYAQEPIEAPCNGRLRSVEVAEGAPAGPGTLLAIVDEEPAAAATLAPIDVCGACGVVRVGHATKCAHCSAPFGEPALQVPRATDLRWVVMECTFRCRMCGFVVPLNHIDVDGAVVCARCSLQQAFDVSGWQGAFLNAHAVADGMAEGVGTKTTSWVGTVPSENQLGITVSPGAPLCEACHAPLHVEIGEGGKATAHCAACDTHVTYTVPRAARAISKGHLRVVLAAEHRTDHAAVKVQETPGAIAVQCPSCSGPLDATDGAKFVVCKFCHATARIPDGVWFRMSGKPPEPEPMWLAFQGPSEARHSADRSKSNQRHEAKVKRLREAKQAWDAQRRREQATARDVAPAVEVAPAHSVADEKQAAGVAQEKTTNRLFLFVIAALVVVAFTVATFIAVSQKTAPPRAAPAPAGKARRH